MTHLHLPVGHLMQRPCTCGAVSLDGDQYVEDGHVLSGMDWMCVPTMRQTIDLPGSTSGHGSAVDDLTWLAGR